MSTAAEMVEHVTPSTEVDESSQMANLSLYVPIDMVRAVDAFAAKYVERLPGVTFSRNAALRYLIDYALQASR